MTTSRASAFLVSLLVASFALSGCLSDSSSSGDAQLSIKMSVKDIDKSNTKKALAKGSVIKLRKLVITLTSSHLGDSVITDTILASDTAGSHFVSNSSIDQSFSKRYKIKPLRHWTVVIKTFDTRDSVIHRDSVLALRLLAGETRVIPLSLSARFVMYEVKFSVPDSLRSSISHMAQKMIITRFVLKVDSTLAIDSVAPGGFVSTPVVHTVGFDYIHVNTRPTLTIQFYGHSEGTNDTLLFQKVIPNVDPEVAQPLVDAIYVGPGSDGTGGALGNLTIVIGKVKTALIEVTPTPTPFKRGAR